MLPASSHNEIAVKLKATSKQVVDQDGLEAAVSVHQVFKLMQHKTSISSWMLPVTREKCWLPLLELNYNHRQHTSEMHIFSRLHVICFKHDNMGTDLHFPFRRNGGR